MVVTDRTSHLPIPIFEAPNGDELGFAHSDFFMAGMSEAMAAYFDGAVVIEAVNLH